MKFRLQIIPAIVFLVLFIVGCNGNPTSPGTDQIDQATPRSETGLQSHHNLGYFNVIIDPDTMGVELLPGRSTEIHLNLTKIFTDTANLAVMLDQGASDPPNGLFVVDFTLTHPFETETQFCIFDVKGIVMVPGSLAIGPLLFSDTNETQVLNADGYTRWWNPTEFTQPGLFGYTDGLFTNSTAGQLTATVNPYKYFADILGPEDSLSAVYNEPLDNDAGRGIFSTGGSVTRRYEVRFQMDPVPDWHFAFVIDGCWDIPVPNPPDAVPDDFPIKANQPEAYDVVVAAKTNSLYYDSESGTGGGVLRLQVNVHDWQGQDAAAIAAEIDGVRIYSPDLFSGGADALFLDELEIKARYTADLTGIAVPTHSGETLLAVKATSAGGPNYDQGTGNPAPDSSVAAWETLILNIPDPECSADTSNDFSEALLLDLENPTIDQLCAPGDYKDFFLLSLPLGSDVYGDLTLFCDAEPTTFGLYDDTESLIYEEAVSGGTAVIDLNLLGIMPGDYYVRVLTQTSGQAFLYMIEPDLYLPNVTPDNPVNVTPEDLFFYPQRISVAGDLVFTETESVVWIYDHTDKLQPEFLNLFEIYNSEHPAFSITEIYNVHKLNPGDVNIELYDITDPTNEIFYPDILHYTTDVYLIARETDYLYVAYYSNPGNSIDIYNISNDPAVPEFLYKLDLNGQPIQLDFVHDGVGPDYWLAVLYDNARLDLFNVTDKGSIPAPDIFTWTNMTIMDICTRDNYVFVLRQHTATYQIYFSTLKIDAGGITGGGTLMLFKDTGDLVTEGNYALCLNIDDTMEVIDVTNPDIPVPFGQVSFPSSINIGDIALENGTLYTSCGRAGVITYDIGDPFSIGSSGSVIGLARPKDMVISGNYLYTIESSNVYHAIKVFSIGDPANAALTWVQNINYVPTKIAKDGDRLIVSTSDPFLLAIDCPDPPWSMTIDGPYAAAGDVSCLALNGDALYVGNSVPQISVWDLSVWTLLTYQTGLPTTNLPISIKFKDDIMYVLAGGEILVYSIVNPLSPNYQGTYVPLSYAHNIEVYGDYLIIATSDTLEIADISNPQSPAYLSYETHPDAPHGEYLAVDNQFAICQPYSWTPPTVIRIWPPDAPTVIGPLYSTDFEVKPNQVLINNGYYYERASGFGVRIWDLY